MLTLFFCSQILLLLIVWGYFFFTRLWNKGMFIKLLLFVLPFAFGTLVLVLITTYFPVETLRSYRNMLYLYSTINSLLLIPQWYKLMCLSLLELPSPTLSDTKKLLLAIFLAVLMVIAIIFFFTLYYLWIDGLSGYSQGLRTALINYEPILLDFNTAFYFSFVTYFTLGYGDLIPYGAWFHFLVFLECLISLLNTGIIIIYAYNVLFNKSS